MFRRWRGSVALVAAAASLLFCVVAPSCTEFNGVSAADDASPFPTYDGGDDVDSAIQDGAPADGPLPGSGYLSTSDAARACARIFGCPLLASSIVESIVVPADGQNFSLCMDWLAGPIPPDRVGLAEQTQALACVSKTATCQAAGACLQVELFDPERSTLRGRKAGCGHHLRR